MEAVKRVEVLTSSIELDALCSRLREIGVLGYSIVHGIGGRGDRARQDAEDLTGVFETSYLLTTCSAEQLPHVIEAIRPVLAAHGGECLVCDALRVRH